MTPRVKTHIRLGIHSVSPSDQSPRCTDEETLSPCLSIAKFRGVSPQNLAEFLRETSRRKPSAKYTHLSDFYFSSRKKKKKKKKKNSRKGCLAAKREKRAFFLGWSVLCLWIDRVIYLPIRSAVMDSDRLTNSKLWHQIGGPRSRFLRRKRNSDSGVGSRGNIHVDFNHIISQRILSTREKIY